MTRKGPSSFFFQRYPRAVRTRAHPAPAITGVLANAALIVGLVRLYHGGAEADERGTSEIDSLTTVLVLGGIAALAALAVRLRYVIARHCATTQDDPLGHQDHADVVGFSVLIRKGRLSGPCR